ncbi:hypothetical protein BCEP4_1610034 [Burkholderia cepacia]|nr:hypothetical protein BCEP4_1610034 [Burkholderia cepacia]
MARPREAPGRGTSVQYDGHHHQAVELSEEFVDFIERRFIFDQLLHVCAESFGKFAVDEDLALRVLVDDFVSAGIHQVVAGLRRKFDDAVVGAVVDHLHGGTPLRSGIWPCCPLGGASLAGFKGLALHTPFPFAWGVSVRSRCL